MRLEKYSIGVGDRFGRQGTAQLRAIQKAAADGITVVPVWNKSYREHSIIGTRPADTRAAADAAVREAGYDGSYYLDADHIGLANVDDFIDPCDFFTLDVADSIGREADTAAVNGFVNRHRDKMGTHRIDGLSSPLEVTEDSMRRAAQTYLGAVAEAGRIYRHIEEKKGADRFITEVSMDETAEPQTPDEMFFILLMLADEQIPAQTVAPKFSGRFNKGVDYVGDTERFAREFADDLAVIRYLVRETGGLANNLKLSVHSGSDKFSLYGPIGKAVAAFDAGLHLKTAGTTWLEELIGLAEAGGEGLDIARQIYETSRAKFDELCGPYATVIDIDTSQLPSVDEVRSWEGPRYAEALRHDPANPRFNPHFRQLLHVGYKVAAHLGDRYLNALDTYAETVSKHVADNIYERHLKRIFG